MLKYSKAIVASVGFIALLAKEIFGLQIADATVNQIADGIIAVGTVAALIRVPNKQ